MKYLKLMFVLIGTHQIIQSVDTLFIKNIEKDPNNPCFDVTLEHKGSSKTITLRSAQTLIGRKINSYINSDIHKSNSSSFFTISIKMQENKSNYYATFYAHDKAYNEGHDKQLSYIVTWKKSDTTQNISEIQSLPRGLTSTQDWFLSISNEGKWKTAYPSSSGFMYLVCSYEPKGLKYGIMDNAVIDEELK